MMIQKTKHVCGHGRRAGSFLDTSLRINGITHLIELISLGPLTTSKFFNANQIRYKSSFLKYCRYCVDNGFMTKYYVKLYTTTPVSTELYEQHPKKYHVMYRITDLGRHWLEITK